MKLIKVIKLINGYPLLFSCREYWTKLSSVRGRMAKKLNASLYEFSLICIMDFFRSQGGSIQLPNRGKNTVLVPMAEQH